MKPALYALRGAALKISKKAYLFRTDESGQGISEYLIILAVVVIAAIALATTFSDQLSSLWESITTQLSSIS